MNHEREYWYIGSILESSETQKYKMAECLATGLYPCLDASISFSVFKATYDKSRQNFNLVLQGVSLESKITFCFSDTWIDKFFDVPRNSTAVSSSKMFPEWWSGLKACYIMLQRFPYQCNLILNKK